MLFQRNHIVMENQNFRVNAERAARLKTNEGRVPSKTDSKRIYCEQAYKFRKRDEIVLSVFSDIHLYDLLIEKISSSIPGQINLFYERRYDTLKARYEDDSIKEIYPEMFRAIVNKKLSLLPNCIDRDSYFDYCPDRSMLPIGGKAVYYKDLTQTEANLLLDSLIRCHKNIDNPIKFEELDKYNEIWSSYKWDKIDRLIPLWTYDNDELGIGKHLLTKFITEVILWSRGIRTKHMDESIFIHGKRGLGKSSICRYIFGQDLHYSLKDNFTASSTFDNYTLFKTKSVIELEETSVFNEKSDNSYLKGWMTSDVLTARSPKSLTEKISTRKYVIVGTTNKKRFLPQDISGRSCLPITITGINPDLGIGNKGSDLHNYIKKNVKQMIAQVIHMLDVEKIPPEKMYPSFFDEYGDKLDEYQKQFIMKDKAVEREEKRIKKENEIAEEKINIIESVSSHIRRTMTANVEEFTSYAIHQDVIFDIVDKFDKKYIKDAMADLGFTKKRWSIKVKGKVIQHPVWVNEEDFVVDDGETAKKKLEYTITPENIKDLPELPNDEEDSSQLTYLPPSPPNRPIPGTELDLPESNAQEEDVKELLKSQYDNSLLGGENRTVEVNSKDKVCITPNLVKPGYHTNYDIGAIPDDQIVAAQYLFLDYDNGTIPEQWDNLMWLREYLPIRLIVFSGNKSLHAYIPLNKNIIDMKYWSKLQEGLNQWLGSDNSIKNPGRLMQSPFEPNPKSDKMPISWIFDDLAVNPDELNWLLEFIPKTKDNKVRREYKYPIGFKTKSPNEVENEITKLLDQIPESVSGSSTYNEFLPVIFSCNAVCDEYSVNKNWLKNTLCSHSPNRSSEIKRAIKSANGSYTSGSFYHLMKEHGLR